MIKPSKWSRYKQISFRIGSGKEAQAYLDRIDAAMKLSRRRSRADWLKLVIDLALEKGESPPPPPPVHAKK